MSTDYVDLVEYIVKNIVDKPDAVVVETVQGRGRSEPVEIRLDPVDVGRVIGKGGRNIEAIRSLVKASAIKEHHRINVEVISEDEAPGAELDTQPEVAAEGGSEADAPSAGRPEAVEG